MGALAGIRLSLVVAVSLAAAFGAAQLEAWTEVLGGSEPDECIGLLGAPDGSVRIGRHEGNTFFVEKFASDGTFAFSTPISTPRVFDMIIDGSGNTIFVGEGTSGNIFVGRVNSSDGSVQYSTQIPGSQGEISARLLYAPDNSVYVSRLYYALYPRGMITRLDNDTGALLGQNLLSFPATSAPYMVLTSNGGIAACYDDYYFNVEILGGAIGRYVAPGVRVRGLAADESGNFVYLGFRE